MRPPVRLLPLLALASFLAASLPVRAEQSPQAPLPQQGTVLLGSRVRVRVEVAVTEEEKVVGLSGRGSLGAGTGMLFPYPLPGLRSMWMLGMRFPLDFLWIRNGRIVDLFEDVPPPAPGQTPRTVASPEPAQSILELPAGFIRRHGVRRGDAVEVNLDRKSP